MLPIALIMFGRLLSYIDPASGSILLQVIMAGAVGALGYFFRPIMRLVRFMRGKSSSSAAAADDAEKKPEAPPKD